MLENKEKPKEEKPKESAIKKAIATLKPLLSLFRDENNITYATIAKPTYRGTHRITDPALSRWIRTTYQKATGHHLRSGDVAEILAHLESDAWEIGIVQPVHLRVANLDGEYIYLDLANEAHEVVEITGDGWKIVPASQAPVKFRRTPAMRAISTPTKGHRITELKNLANLDQDGFIKSVAWLLSALHGTGPFPIFVINGPQGSGKSCFGRLVVQLIDPTAGNNSGMPRAEEAAAVACENTYIQAWDNVSKINHEASDIVCRISTGISYRTRRLFTNGEEYVIETRRPIIVNGIPELVSRGDMAERSLNVRLQKLQDKKDESTIKKDLAGASPRILGALLDIMAGALRRWPESKPMKGFRMADFTRLMVAAEPDCPWPLGGFEAAYRQSQRDAALSILEHDPVAQSILLMRQKAKGRPGPIFKGSLAELLSEIGDVMPRCTTLPRTTRSLRDQLDRLAPVLLQENLGIQTARTGAIWCVVTITDITQVRIVAFCNSEPETA